MKYHRRLVIRSVFKGRILRSNRETVIESRRPGSRRSEQCWGVSGRAASCTEHSGIQLRRGLGRKRQAGSKITKIQFFYAEGESAGASTEEDSRRKDQQCAAECGADGRRRRAETGLPQGRSTKKGLREQPANSCPRKDPPGPWTEKRFASCLRWKCLRVEQQKEENGRIGN